MWKCQNMLRGLVKELLDLHKLPVVCGCKHITETFTYIISTTRLMYTMLFSASAVWGQQHGHVWEANEYCQWVKALSSISPHASWCVLIFLWKFSENVKILFLTVSIFTENLPDAGKAQDFMKKFNQVLGEDEKLRVQLEMLISPTCSCKQAEICVVSCLLQPFPFLTWFRVFPGKSRNGEAYKRAGSSQMTKNIQRLIFNILK